jgi:predicted SAM-dependent methyltransferase
MKTPMQEVYENFNLMSDADFKAWMLNTDLLEKEKEVIVRSFMNVSDNRDTRLEDVHLREFAEDYYNKTFNTKER